MLFGGAKASIKYMVENDTIINISSIAGKGEVLITLLVATKFGNEWAYTVFSKRIRPKRNKS